MSDVLFIIAVGGFGFAIGWTLGAVVLEWMFPDWTE